MAKKASKKAKLKTFVAIYLAASSGNMLKKWEKMDAKTRKQKQLEGISAWHAWLKKNKKSLVDIGSPLGATLRTDSKGVHATRNAMTGYAVVKAKSHKAAAALFLDHPHFRVFPGKCVEIMECTPIPEDPAF